MKQLKLEVSFEVYGKRGFEEKVFRERSIFTVDSPKFGKASLLKVAKWMANCMRTYNAGVHLTPAQVEYLGKRKGGGEWTP